MVKLVLAKLIPHFDNFISEGMPSFICHLDFTHIKTRIWVQNVLLCIPFRSKDLYIGSKVVNCQHMSQCAIGVENAKAQ